MKHLNRTLVSGMTFWLVILTVFTNAAGITEDRISETHRHVFELDSEGRVGCSPISREEWENRYRIQSRTTEVKGPRTEVRYATQFADIHVTYIGFSEEAKQAFGRAVEIWAETIVSSEQIRIQANWEPLGDSVLGQAGANFVYLIDGVWYSDALADSILGSDQEPRMADIEATFNSTFKDWYFGVDQSPPFDKYDFLTIVLHEIGHGLGLTTTLTVESGVGKWGTASGASLFPKVFDIFLSDDDLYEYLIDKYQNNTTAFGDVLQGNNLYFDAEEAVMANHYRPVRIYAPIEYAQGSSFSHLDEFQFPEFDRDSLMTPTIYNGEVQHDPGPVVRGILRDMGWKTVEATHFAQFAAGAGWSSDLVIQNSFPSNTQSIMRGSIEIYDSNGNEINPSSVFPGSDGTFEIGPSGTKTFSSRSSGSAVFGTVTVKSDRPASGVIRFTFPGTGVAGVNPSPIAAKVTVPVRKLGSLSSGVAYRNIQDHGIDVQVSLYNEDGILVSPGGQVNTFVNSLNQVSGFIQETFNTYFTANPGDFRGSMVIRALNGKIAAVGVEFESGSKITTLPVTPIP
jgi:hypothetical protein